MMEEADDVEIQDRASQTKNFHEHIDDDRIDPCIGGHQTSSYAMQHHWLSPKLFPHLEEK